ncbi:enoyl-CoA hydratase [Halobacillus andaensis]|uniref:Enoyl-CoA hydratase n=1 Tax=Halobacillus andaensis TaxID=1176239 RepID=A0A917AYA6_HALAA|nr:enoyl-CoA hydratase-related protein [Halobacillus andaensis]MBP2003365.1 enoyl-CoA hydratase/carnithine racemase [Halobacillus andaensis]GGF10091.1 enoyl-CoA hydratase [Halobacillus andaensis]
MAGVELEFIDSQIALLTLTRREAANSLSIELLDELSSRLDEIEASNARVAVITGSGEKAFCAGADLKERAGMSDEEVVQTVRKIGDTVMKLEQLSIPTIAMINGAAYGGGLELALACDIRTMSEAAKCGLTETSLAIIPGAGGTQRLPRLIGLGKAKELIFTATPVTAAEALNISLVEHVYSGDQLVEQTLTMARAIAQNGPVALKMAKTSIQYGSETDLRTGLEFERQCYKQTIPTIDRMEGLRAFKEKRKPEYTGK